MKLKEILKVIMYDNHLTNEGLSKKIGKEHASAIGNILVREDCKVSRLIEICNACEYDIVIKNRNNRTASMLLNETPNRVDKRGKKRK